MILAQRKDLQNIKEVYPEEIHNGETTIDEILQNEEKKNIENYRLTEEQIKIVNIWDEFAKNSNGKLPGFPFGRMNLVKL